MRLGMVFAILLAGFVLGCSSEPAAVPVTAPTSPAKGILEELAKTGEMTSGMNEIESHLNSLKATDAAKADKLLKEYVELQSAKSPQEIRAKAKAMADQL